MKKKMILFNMTLSGGAGKYIVTLARALAKAGCDVHIVIYKNTVDYEIPEGVEFHMLLEGNAWKESSKVEKALQDILIELEPFDLILSNSTPSNKILSRLRLPNAYHVVHSAETKNYKGFLAPLKQWWRKRTYRKLYSGKYLITVSNGLMEYIVKDLNARPLSIQTIYNPFDFDEILQKAEEPIEEIPKEPYIINVARYSLVQKRQDILLYAYKKVDTSFKLVLLGEGEDEAKIRKLIEELKFRDKVLLPGFSDNPYAWIKHADLLVLSSAFEGFGRVLVEALILGTPVVSTNCPTGPQEILTGVLSDFLVPTENTTALAEKISQALKQYPKIEDIDLTPFNNGIIATKFIELMKNN